MTTAFTSQRQFTFPFMFTSMVFFGLGKNKERKRREGRKKM